jgi:hypothetical protein
MYFDDSGTSPVNTVAVAAGWISRVSYWIPFEKKWEQARKVKGEEFECMHMAEFVYGQKDSGFENWDLPKKQRVAARLRAVIKKFAFKGFALGISKNDYDAVVPSTLRAQEGYKNHYTYAIKRVLGMIATWRHQQNLTDCPVEYVFDWLERKDSKRKEIETIFDRAAGEHDAFVRYGLRVDGIHFKRKEDTSPLQAADILAWLTYRWVLNEQEGKKINPVAFDSFPDFYKHKNKTFLEGGHQNKQHLAKWVKEKGY